MYRFRLSTMLLSACCCLLVVSHHFFISLVHSREHSSKCPLKVPSNVENRPLKTIIAHRGASFSLPEHTLEAYRLALDLGADYIEPDLVSTKDGKLIALHTMDLNITTNVASVYPGRTSFSSFANKTGYWAHDFDLDELKVLKVHQRLSNTGARSTAYDGLFSIPTLAEILILLEEYNTKVIPLLQTTKKRVGLYAELKYPEWLQRDTNMSMVDMFLDQLKLDLPPDSPVWNDTECEELKFNEYLVPPLVIQSFNGFMLKQIYNKWTHRTYPGTVPPPMVLLVDIHHCWLDDFWYHVGEWSIFLDGIGPDKWCLVGEESRPFLNRAREHQLAIHPWTLYGEREFGLKTSSSVADELEHWFCEDEVDGVFVENVDVAVRVASSSCPSDEDEQPEPTPVPTPTTGEPTPLATVEDATLTPGGTSTTTKAQQLCYNSNDEQQFHVGLVAGIIGVLLGCFFGFWLSNSRFCRSRRLANRRQVAIPTQADVGVDAEVI